MTHSRPSQCSPSTLRPLSVQLSPLNQADGSASLKAGNTHIMVAIYGPVAPRISHRERIDRGLVNVIFSKGAMMPGCGRGVSIDGDESGESMKPLATPLPPGGGATERELEYFLADALSSCIMLERYPRCVIQVVVQVIQADGGVLGTAANCAVMALMDACVAIRGLPVASTFVVVSKPISVNNDDNNSIWIDPSAEEESMEGCSIVTLITKASSGSGNEEDNSSGVLNSFTCGAPVSMTGLMRCVDGTIMYNTAMVAFMRMAIEQKVKKEVETLWS